MKNQLVRRVLQDNKVPGTNLATRAAAAPDPEPTRSAARFLGARLGYVRVQVLVWTGGLE